MSASGDPPSARDAPARGRPPRRTVAVLFGGRSAEHEISCISARSVIDALDPERHDVIAIGITREGRWQLLPGAPALPSETGRMPEVTDGQGRSAELVEGRGASRELAVADGGRQVIDVVFPVLHGPFGEDGATQGLLELAGVPFVGPGVLGSALGMDKAVQKVLFAAAGLPIVPFEVVRETDWREDAEGVTARVEDLGAPVFVKPATLGSSVGISRVLDIVGLPAGLEQAFRYARKAVVEAAVQPVREVECAVLGNDDPVASVVGEIVPRGHEFYDYEAKYLDEDGAELVIPASLTGQVASRIQQMAVAAFQAVEGAGMARVDFFLRGDDELWLNEINTIPGFTSISMYPKLWEASGVPYPELVERLLDLAVERHSVDRQKATDVRELAGDGPVGDGSGGRAGR